MRAASLLLSRELDSRPFALAGMRETTVLVLASVTVGSA
jgi:hypothetical protein